MVSSTLLGVVMMSKVLSAAALAAALIGGQAAAQSVAGVGGPREQPPAGYTQQQYVDSRGCVFLRAGLGDTVRWVPRVGPDRKALCGATPTFQQAREAATALDAQTDAPETDAPDTATAMTATEIPAPAVSARVPLAPAPTVATATVAAAPVLRAPDLTVQRPMQAPLPSPITAAQAPLALAPAPAPAAAPVLAGGTLTGNRIACFKSAPVLQRVALSNGGSALVCTRGDGSLTGWRAPVFPGQAVVGASLTPPAGRSAASASAPMMATAVPERTAPRVALTAPAATPPAPATTRVVAAPPLPKGYVLSWKDDRLNPMRGLGTAQGQAQQDSIWTRDLPAEAVTVKDGNRLVFFSSKGEAAVAAPAPNRVAVSSMNTSTVPSRTYVQVGAFGDPANAQGASARLAAAGLPVASQRAKGLKVILAGPFPSAAEAQQALSTVRGAGFGEAFIR
jgi:hypothetical protein